MKRILLYAIYFVNLAILFASCNGGKGGKTDPQPDTTTPEITSLSKTQVKETEIITITGKNFSATKEANIVKFNGKLTYVKAATATELTVYVPPFAKSGKVTVEVAGKTSTGSDITVEAFAGKRLISVIYKSFTHPAEALWASIDKGVTFAPLLTEGIFKSNGYSYNDFAIQGNEIYVTNGPEGVMRSKDKGETWEKVNLGIPAATEILSEDVVIFNNVIIIAIRSATQYGGLYISEDNGVSFTQKIIDQNAADLFVMGNKAYFACQNKKSYSTNDGTTWSPLSETWGGDNEELRNIGATTNKIFISTRAKDAVDYNGKYFYSDDQGQTWKAYAELTKQSKTFMQVNSQLFISSINEGLFKIEDNLNKTLLSNFFILDSSIIFEEGTYYMPGASKVYISPDFIDIKTASTDDPIKPEANMNLFFFL